jgi:N-acetylmuramoyl-L-alanine amidase
MGSENRRPSVRFFYDFWRARACKPCRNGALMTAPMTAARAPSFFVFLVLFAALLAVLAAGAPTALSEERPPAQPSVAACQPGDFRVVLDVGHTADVPGAISARGIPEYVFNMRLAADIKDALVEAGFDKTVLLVTDQAPPLGLLKRAWSANKLDADLFVSIHHDSLPDYLLQTWEYAGHQEHYNDDFPGYAIFISNENAEHAGSLAFGHVLGKALQAQGLAYTPHYTLPVMRHRRRQLLDADAGVYRYDALVVLQRTRMPAVLLEAGSIINRTEELEMATPERRKLISTAMVSAVTEFCAGRALARRDHRIRRLASPDVAPLRRHVGVR